MKTAEEILRKSMENYIDHTTQAFDEWMQEADYKCVIEAMKEYAREACVEQIKRCADVAFDSAVETDGHEMVLNTKIISLK